MRFDSWLRWIGVSFCVTYASYNRNRKSKRFFIKKSLGSGQRNNNGNLRNFKSTRNNNSIKKGVKLQATPPKTFPKEVGMM